MEPDDDGVGPDLVTAEDRADSDAMANARDIHDATIELIRTMVPYLLEEADTRDLGVWGFIYVILVFMRSLKTRPALLEWFGSAFHAKVLAPFINMLLREDESRGGPALESASQSELITVYSLLNERKKLGKYGFSTEDNLRKYHREQEEKGRARQEYCHGRRGCGRDAAAEEATAKDTTATPEESTVTTDDNTVTPEESTATTEETTTGNAAHETDGDTKTPDWECMYGNLLPEHSLLSGLFFAREAEPGDKSLEDPTDAVVVTCPPAPEAPAAVQTAEEPAVEQAQEESLTDSEADSETDNGVLTDPESENEAGDEVLTVLESESKAHEGEQTKREAVEAPLAEMEKKSRHTGDDAYATFLTALPAYLSIVSIMRNLGLACPF
ncbi:hypothetical protein B0T10DRAFT_587943 [Thelonectria olida]|uniref:Uncharacterized protein n=1 Tax=Thelonectria olida TaxID=1576542 RepID=A0A9P9AL74_9HYPO|nr:hypothetical protein B0T10DRAFT_587943 [Thelonectria olida]